MRLGIVGQGPWGQVYARTLKRLGLKFWQATTDWHCFNADGVIVATPPETHYSIARTALARRIPVLVEKPVALTSGEARGLVDLGGIAFAGHTRLYSPAWREFKSSLPRVERVEAWAGGTQKDPWWDWGPHLVAMSFDLGFESPVIHVTQEAQPLRFVVNGEHTFTDVETSPTPLEALVLEFCAAIESGQPDNAGLQLGARVISFLENECPSRITRR